MQTEQGHSQSDKNHHFYVVQIIEGVMECWSRYIVFVI